MSKLKSGMAATIVPLTLIVTTAVFPQEAAEPQPTKLAVLRISYEAFSENEKQLVEQTFYEHLAQGGKIEVVSEQEAKDKLIPLGINPAEINDEAGYIHAGQVLNVDYVLVGNMDKIGDFVEVTFRLFKMPRGTQKRYPGGKTLDMLVEEEIPNIVDLIYRDMGLLQQTTEKTTIKIPTPEEAAEEITQKKDKKSLWPWIAVGGAAVGGAAAVFFLSSGGNDGNGTDIPALPRPPNVP